MKLIKFQLGGNIKNLPLTDVLKFQLNQVNPLTGKKPEIRGWEINNGELDVVTAESGTKLESKEATPFMNFFKFLIPGFKLAYDQKLALRNYDAKMKALYRVRVPLLETPESVYKPKVLLAKKPYTTAPVALNKPILKNKGGLIKKHLLGTYKGGIQPADNTRVASGRPQQINNKIPYGAGKGQAGQNPLVYLWNNPYVAGTMMAMGPIAMKGNKRFEDLVSPKKPLIDFKPEMFLNLRQVLKHRDPKGIGKLLENKYGPAQEYHFNTGTSDAYKEAGWRLSPELYQEAIQLFK